MAAANGEILLDVQDLTKYFPITKGAVSSNGGPREGGGRHQFSDSQRRNSGSGRRERLRQNDSGFKPDAPNSANSWPNCA